MTHFHLLLAWSFILYIFNNASKLHSHTTEYDLRGCRERGRGVTQTCCNSVGAVSCLPYIQFIWIIPWKATSSSIKTCYILFSFFNSFLFYFVWVLIFPLGLMIVNSYCFLGFIHCDSIVFDVVNLPLFVFTFQSSVPPAAGIWRYIQNLFCLLYMFLCLLAGSKRCLNSTV